MHRLWDKVLAISYNLEIIVAFLILQSQKKEISTKSPHQLKEYMSNVSRIILVRDNNEPQLMLSPTQASGIIVKMMESQTLLKNDFISRHMEPVGRYFPLSNI